MRIGVLWHAPQKLDEITVRHELWIEGLRALGHQATLFSTRGSAAGFPFDCFTVDSREDFASADFWKARALDAVILITWHRSLDILRALHESGTPALAVSDSDGQVSSRLYPRATFERLWVERAPGALPAARTVATWLRSYVRSSAEDRVIVESAELGAALFFCWPLARDRFARILHANGRGDLVSRLRLAPYPVRAPFFGLVPTTRGRKAVAVGRWDSGQKNAPLLVASMERLLAEDPAVSFVVIGRDTGDGALRRLAAGMPRVEYREKASAAELSRELGSARILLSTTRWESGPIVASEALAMGCSLVGGSDTGFRDIVENGRFGTVYGARSRDAVADAVKAELARWDRGERDPGAIASTWRERVSPAGVASTLLSGLDQRARKRA